MMRTRRTRWGDSRRRRQTDLLEDEIAGAQDRAAKAERSWEDAVRDQEGPGLGSSCSRAPPSVRDQIRRSRPTGVRPTTRRTDHHLHRSPKILPPTGRR